MVEGEDKESYASEFADFVFLNEEDFGTRLKRESHKDIPKTIEDKEEKKKKKNDKKDDDDNDDDDDHIDHASIKDQERVDGFLNDIVPNIASNATKYLIDNNLLGIVATDVIDAFRKRDHDDHHGDAPPPEGEKIEKRQKISKDSPVIDEDEVIPENETFELIKEFQNIDKHVPTIYDHERIEATLRDMMSNQFRCAKEYAYHLEQSNNYMED
nr:hypothetical protein [Tanacetum cinerariifolium]